jgi:esterase/lipase
MGLDSSLTFHGPFGTEGEGVLYIHGYGGSLGDPGLMGFLEGISAGGFSVTCVLLPRTFSDIDEGIVKPLREHISDNGTLHVIGFSLGGLVSSALEVRGCRTFISPFWGVGRLIEPIGLKGALAIATGSAKAVIDRSKGRPTIGWEWIGQVHPSVEALDTTVNAVEKALRNIPAPLPGDLIIASPSDRIISMEAVRDRKARTVLLKGGHMLFSGSDRSKLIGLVLASLKGDVSK